MLQSMGRTESDTSEQLNNKLGAGQCSRHWHSAVEKVMFRQSSKGHLRSKTVGLQFLLRGIIGGILVLCNR